MSYIRNNGIRIHYQVEGQGMPLVLQHGLSESLEGWYDCDFVEPLKSQFQLIMIDARGHGASDKPHDAAAYDLKLMVGDVVAVLTQLRLDRVHYYGNSMGCRIGFGMAKYAPQFIRAFIMGGHHPYAESRQFFRQIFAQGLETWVNLLEDMAGPISSETKQRMFSNDLEALRAVVAKDHPDISDILPTMNMSCRLFAGSQDPWYPLVKRSAWELPNGRFFPLFGLNHFQAYIRQDLIAPIITPYIIQLLTEQEQLKDSPVVLSN